MSYWPWDDIETQIARMSASVDEMLRQASDATRYRPANEEQGQREAGSQNATRLPAQTDNNGVPWAVNPENCRTLLEALMHRMGELSTDLDETVGSAVTTASEVKVLMKAVEDLNHDIDNNERARLKDREMDGEYVESTAKDVSEKIESLEKHLQVALDGVFNHFSTQSCHAQARQHEDDQRVESISHTCKTAASHLQSQLTFMGNGAEETMATVKTLQEEFQALKSHFREANASTTTFLDSLINTHTKESKATIESVNSSLTAEITGLTSKNKMLLATVESLAKENRDQKQRLTRMQFGIQREEHCRESMQAEFNLKLEMMEKMFVNGMQDSEERFSQRLSKVSDKVAAANDLILSKETSNNEKTTQLEGKVEFLDDKLMRIQTIFDRKIQSAEEDSSYATDSMWMDTQAADQRLDQKMNETNTKMWEAIDGVSTTTLEIAAEISKGIRLFKGEVGHRMDRFELSQEELKDKVDATPGQWESVGCDEGSFGVDSKSEENDDDDNDDNDDEDDDSDCESDTMSSQSDESFIIDSESTTQGDDDDEGTTQTHPSEEEGVLHHSTTPVDDDDDAPEADDLTTVAPESDIPILVSSTLHPVPDESVSTASDDGRVVGSVEHRGGRADRSFFVGALTSAVQATMNTW